jgi:hypothetical protein
VGIPKRVPWDILIEVVGRFPEGASLEEVVLVLDPTVPRRTLQRWLASLVKNNDLVAIGRARARRYKLLHIPEYERSCIRYSITRKAIGEPDPFRMQYRNAIKSSVGEIVRLGMNKTQAISAIRQQAFDSIPTQDQSRFIEIVERELLSLHEGNIARYQLRPMEYEN